jgi:hypothetical protein
MGLSHALWVRPSGGVGLLPCPPACPLPGPRAGPAPWTVYACAGRPPFPAIGAVFGRIPGGTVARFAPRTGFAWVPSGPAGGAAAVGPRPGCDVPSVCVPAPVAADGESLTHGGGGFCARHGLVDRMSVIRRLLRTLCRPWLAAESCAGSGFMAFSHTAATPHSLLRGTRMG